MLLSCGAAVGLPASPARAETHEAARDYFRAGIEAAKRGDLQTARTEYLRAFELASAFDIACNLGHVEAALEMWPEATEHLDYCLDHYAASARPEIRSAEQKFRELREAARSRVATIRLVVRPEGGVFLSVGERRLGGPPFPQRIYVRPGEHVVTAKRDGRTVASRTLRVQAGQDRELVLDVDGQESSAVAKPMAAASAPAASTSADATGDAGVAMRSWVPAYVLGGVSVVAGVTSLVFRGMASSDVDDAEELREALTPGACAGAASSECRALESKARSSDTKATVADVSLAVTGVGVAATAGYVVYTLLQPESPVAATATWDRDRGASLFVRGHF